MILAVFASNYRDITYPEAIYWGILKGGDCLRSLSASGLADIHSVLSYPDASVTDTPPHLYTYWAHLYWA